MRLNLEYRLDACFELGPFFGPHVHQVILDVENNHLDSSR